MCFGVCWSKDIGWFPKTFIKSKMHLALPTPSCVVNDFGMPTLPFYSQSHLLFCSDGAKLTVISVHKCEQSPMPPETQGTCVPQPDGGKALSFLSTPIHPFFPCPMFSSRALSCLCSGPEKWSVATQYGPACLKNIIEFIVLIPTCHGSIQTLKCSLTLIPYSQVHTLLPWEPFLIASAS